MRVDSTAGTRSTMQLVYRRNYFNSGLLRLQSIAEPQTPEERKLEARSYLASVLEKAKYLGIILESKGEVLQPPPVIVDQEKVSSAEEDVVMGGTGDPPKNMHTDDAPSSDVFGGIHSPLLDNHLVCNTL